MSLIFVSVYLLVVVVICVVDLCLSVPAGCGGDLCVGLYFSVPVGCGGDLCRWFLFQCTC